MTPNPAHANITHSPRRQYDVKITVTNDEHAEIWRLNRTSRETIEIDTFRANGRESKYISTEEHPIKPAQTAHQFADQLTSDRDLEAAVQRARSHYIERSRGCSHCGEDLETARITIRISQSTVLKLCSRQCAERAFDAEAHNSREEESGFCYYPIPEGDA